MKRVELHRKGWVGGHLQLVGTVWAKSSWYKTLLLTLWCEYKSPVYCCKAVQAQGVLVRLQPDEAFPQIDYLPLFKMNMKAHETSPIRVSLFFSKKTWNVHLTQ